MNNEAEIDPCVSYSFSLLFFVMFCCLLVVLWSETMILACVLHVLNESLICFGLLLTHLFFISTQPDYSNDPIWDKVMLVTVRC